MRNKPKSSKNKLNQNLGLSRTEPNLNPNPQVNNVQESEPNSTQKRTEQNPNPNVTVVTQFLH